MTAPEMEELERYRTFHRRMLQRQAEIPRQLEALRQAGKGKTVAFKELLSEKLVVEAVLTQLRYAGFTGCNAD